MALNVFGSSQQYLGVVVELPETQIAGVAQQSADLARDVVVVENNFDIVSHGRHRNAVKTRCPQGHSLSGSNLVNFELPYRKCRACAAAHAYVQRNPAESFEYHADRYYKRYAPREVA